MTTLRTIIFNAGAQIGGKFFSTILGVAAVMIMTRYLGSVQFGWYTTAVGFLQFVGLLSDFGFTVTTAHMLAEPEFDKKRLFHTLFTWRFLSALLFNGLAPIAIIFFPYPAPVKYAVAIASVSFFALALIQIFIGYYQVKIKTSLVAMGEIIGRIILLLGVILAGYFGWSFLLVMTVVALGSIGNLVYLWSRCGMLPRFCLDKKISCVIFKKIWPNATAVLLNAFYLQGDRVILPLFVAQALVGLYGAAYRVLDLVIQIATLIMGMMLPLLTFSWSRGRIAEYKQRYHLAISLMILVLLPLLVGIMVKAEEIMHFIAGDNFIGSGNILRYLSVSIIGLCLGVTFGYVALAINRQRQVLWVYGSNAFLSILGYLIFIPWFGVNGAIGVTIFSEIYAGIFLAIMVTRYIKIWPPFSKILKIILANILLVLLLLALPFLSLFSSIIIGAVFYGGLLMVLKIVSRRSLTELFSKNLPSEV